MPISNKNTKETLDARMLLLVKAGSYKDMLSTNAPVTPHNLPAVKSTGYNTSFNRKIIS